MFKILLEWNIGSSETMTLFWLLEDEVRPGVVNIAQGLSFMEATIRFLVRQGCQIRSLIQQEKKR